MKLADHIFDFFDSIAKFLPNFEIAHQQNDQQKIQSNRINFSIHYNNNLKYTCPSSQMNNKKMNEPTPKTAISNIAIESASLFDYKWERETMYFR